MSLYPPVPIKDICLLFIIKFMKSILSRTQKSCGHGLAYWVSVGPISRSWSHVYCDFTPILHIHRTKMCTIVQNVYDRTSMHKGTAVQKCAHKSQLFLKCKQQCSIVATLQVNHVQLRVPIKNIQRTRRKQAFHFWFRCVKNVFLSNCYGLKCSVDSIGIGIHIGFINSKIMLPDDGLANREKLVRIPNMKHARFLKNARTSRVAQTSTRRVRTRTSIYPLIWTFPVCNYAIFCIFVLVMVCRKGCGGGGQRPRKRQYHKISYTI